MSADFKALGSYAGPSIPTSGLIMLWDVADANSYPGTGTTIYDLSGNGYNGSFVNAITYSSSTNMGLLETNGTTSYIRGGPYLYATPHSVICGSRYKPGSGGGRVVTTYGNNWLLGHWGNGVGRYYGETWVYQTGDLSNEWHIHACTSNFSNSAVYYVDGAVKASVSATVYGPVEFSVGGWNGSSEYSYGQLSFLMAYNRVLTAAEMQQIYSAYRGRFGL